MKRKGLYACVAVFFIGLSIACEKDFNIDVGTHKPKLIVEAYINNAFRNYNYVVLSKSQSYTTTDLYSVPVRNASVFITEGEIVNNTYRWDPATRKQLREVHIPRLSPALMPGFYFDTMLVSNSPRALLGKSGKSYLLEIETEGKKYTATTNILQPLVLDSVTSGYHFWDVDDDTAMTKARITAHFKDPDTLGNSQLYYWRQIGNRQNFGWGGLGNSRYVAGTDDLVNGQYIHLTHSASFVPGDSVNYFLINVPRDIYNFWDSYNKARENNGPFSTPINLKNTIQGEDVIGSFNGFSVATKSIKVE